MRIVVLNDQETYTNAEGCLFLDVPDGLNDSQIKDIAVAVASLPDLTEDLVFVDDAEVEVPVTVLARF